MPSQVGVQAEALSRAVSEVSSVLGISHLQACRLVTRNTTLVSRPHAEPTTTCMVVARMEVCCMEMRHRAGSSSKASDCTAPAPQGLGR